MFRPAEVKHKENNVLDNKNFTYTENLKMTVIMESSMKSSVVNIWTSVSLPEIFFLLS